jgi:hypothetical protein
MVDVDELNINDIEIDSDLLADLLIGNKVKVLIQDCDTIRWKQELEADRDQLVKLLHAAQQITPERDRKLKALKELIRQKITMPLNPGNKKLLVFTAFADTAILSLPTAVRLDGKRIWDSFRFGRGDRNKPNHVARHQDGYSFHPDQFFATFQGTSQERASCGN